MLCPRNMRTDTPDLAFCARGSVLLQVPLNPTFLRCVSVNPRQVLCDSAPFRLLFLVIPHHFGDRFHRIPSVAVMCFIVLVTAGAGLSQKALRSCTAVHLFCAPGTCDPTRHCSPNCTIDFDTGFTGFAAWFRIVTTLFCLSRHCFV